MAEISEAGISASTPSRLPSYVTSTTSVGFLIVVAGATAFAIWTKNTDLMLKLVEMYVPAYLMGKGFSLGKATANGNPPSTPPPSPPSNPA